MFFSYIQALIALFAYIILSSTCIQGNYIISHLGSNRFLPVKLACLEWIRILPVCVIQEIFEVASVKRF